MKFSAVRGVPKTRRFLGANGFGFGGDSLRSASLASSSARRRAEVERRERLRQLVADLGRPQVVFSEGIVGSGRALFKEVSRQGLEGMVAKRLSSRYRPGKRTTAWQKIKPRLR